MVNARIVSSEGEIISDSEGCLSVPDFRADVKRSERILVEGIDREGRPQRVEAEGLHAIVLQHEIDHLNGRLFIDRISSLKRELYKRRVRKAMRDNETAL
jgi:peptide deformylase